MKKNFLYLFTVLCTLSLFTACSDDDEKGDPNGLDVNKSYSGESLDLSYSDAPMLGKEISFNTKDGKTATITMKGTLDLSAIRDLIGGLKSTATPAVAPGVIPGELMTTLENVPLTLSGDSYTFMGTDNSKGREISYSGTVKKDKLTLSLDVTFGNAIAYQYMLAAPYLSIDWQSPAKITVDASWMGLPPAEMQVQIGQIMPKVNGQIATLLPMVFQGLTFRPDGNVTATYKKAEASSWNESPLNLAQYYLKDDKLYLQLNLAQIIATATANKSKAESPAPEAIIKMILEVIPELLPYLTSGIPLSYTLDGDVMKVTAEKELLLKLLNIVSNENVAPVLISLLPANSNLTPIVKGILPQLPAVLKETTELNATLVMKRK